MKQSGWSLSWLFRVQIVFAVYGIGVAHAQVTTGASYRINSLCGNGTKVMSIANSSTSNEAAAVIATRDDLSKAQLFRFDPTGSGYRITNLNSGKVLDISRNSTEARAAIWQYDFHGRTNQQFKIQKTSDGYYRFQSVSTGMFIDLTGANTTDGNPFIQYPSNTSCAQKFRLIPVASTSTPLPKPTVPKPTPTPAPAPTPVPSGASITIDQVIASQQASAHEAIPMSPMYDWQRKPVITMQSPAKADIPSWFEGSRPEWCTVLNSWMQTFEAEGNASTNSRVQYKNMRLYVLSESTRKWTRYDLVAGPNTDTWKYPFDFSSGGGVRAEATGGVSGIPDYPYFLHGYGNVRNINGPDVRAVFAAIEFRLIVNNTSLPDDRAKARYVLNLGADYWPAAQNDWSYAPGVGHGKLLLAKPEWRTATMLVPNGRYGATFSEMKSNPPPLVP